jgi:predicted GH43/DUF377 family glycosyl hydrolase
MNPIPPRVERLHGSRPIIEKIDRHDWENRVTFNPACVLVTDPDAMQTVVGALPLGEAVRALLLGQKALAVLLYRAQGKKTEAYDHTRSSLGLAICSPELDLLARLDRPVILPDQPYENLGVEDPRITRIGDRYPRR